MKFNLIKSRIVANGWNLSLLFAAVSLVSMVFVSGSAQLKKEKKITAIQVGSAAEGARVTIVSDAGLNDYEAFRRGERFYVKIPLGEFATSRPGFRGDGFDDVQVQKVGDSAVISFKLQPGASARVDQHGNRLEVMFTSIARTRRPGTVTAASNRATAVNTTLVANNQVNPVPGRDAAGPSPADVSSSRERFVNEPQNARQSASHQPVKSPVGSANSNASLATNSPTATATPVSGVSPSPQQNFPAWTNSPAPASPNSTPRSNGFSTTAANKKVVFLGGLIAAALLGLTIFLYRRPRKLVQAKRVKPPLSQPRYSTDIGHDVFHEESPVAVERPAHEPAKIFASEIEEIPDWRRTPIEPTFTPNTASTNEAINSTPGPNPAFVANGNASSEEREVFEL